MNWDAIIIICGWLLAIASGGVIVFWGLAILMVQAGKRAAPTVKQGLTAVSRLDRNTLPKISVIIPAHNEEEMISDAIASILNCDYPNFEIIIAADRCSDKTVSVVSDWIAKDCRVHLVEIDSCPDDWSGKCHASYCGAVKAGVPTQSTTTEELTDAGGTKHWLLFTDADTLFHPDLMAGMIGIALDKSLVFVSALGRLRCKFGYEKTSQPLAATALMMMYPINRANRADPDKRRPFANGQFMLIRKDAYLDMGTHHQIRKAILEDLKMALRLNKAKKPIGLTMAKDHLTVRMYQSTKDFRSGWKRILIEGANRNTPRLRGLAWRLRMIAAMPLVSVTTLVLGLLLLAYGQNSPLSMATLILSTTAVMAQLIGLGLIYRLQGAPLWTLWRFPFGCLGVISIIREAISDLNSGKGIGWGSMQYDITPKSELDKP